MNSNSIYCGSTFNMLNEERSAKPRSNIARSNFILKDGKKNDHLKKRTESAHADTAFMRTHNLHVSHDHKLSMPTKTQDQIYTSSGEN